MGSDTVKLTSVLDFIQQLKLWDTDSDPGAKASHTKCNSSTLIIEGKEKSSIYLIYYGEVGHILTTKPTGLET